MSTFSRRPRRAASEIPDAALAALLAGGTPPPDAPAPLQHVADVLAALQATPASDEAVGQAAALAEFRQRVGVSPQPLRSHRRRRPSRIASRLSARTAAVGAVAVVGLGGFASAAFADALPASAQQFAHDSIGAPSPHGHTSAHAGNRMNPDHPGTPVGPSASGSAAYGLCNAYAHASKHGTAAQKAVAFRNLEKAAGGAANVHAFCASVPHHGAKASHGAASTSHQTGERASHQTGPPTSHPTGPPKNS
jgi:hypothetical protein